MKHDLTTLKLVATMEYGDQPTVCMAQGAWHTVAQKWAQLI